MGAKEACGVFGAYSSKGTDVVPKILKGLEALQHRGQESWGIAVHGQARLQEDGPGLQLDQLRAGARRVQGRLGHRARPVLDQGPLQPRERAAHPDRDRVLHRPQRDHRQRRASCQKTVSVVSQGRRLRHRHQGGRAQAPPDPQGGERLVLGLRAPRQGGDGGLLLHDTQQAGRGLRRAATRGATGRSASGSTRSRAPTSPPPRAAPSRPSRPSSSATSSRGRWSAWAAPRGASSPSGSRPRSSPPTAPSSTPTSPIPSSVIDGVNVYEARKNVGKILARRRKMKGKVVIPVPDSARPAALGYSTESGIPMDEGLMKDRYRRKGSMRSFIEPRQGGREEVVKRIIPIKETIQRQGRHRGRRQRRAGDELEDNRRRAPRGRGQEHQDGDNLPADHAPVLHGGGLPQQGGAPRPQVATRRDRRRGDKRRRSAKSLGVDELHYNDIDGLAEAIGLPKESLCFACINGDYSKLGIAEPRRRDEGLTPLARRRCRRPALQHRNPRLGQGEQHARHHPLHRAGQDQGREGGRRHQRQARRQGPRDGDGSTGSRRYGSTPRRQPAGGTTTGGSSTSLRRRG